MTIGIGRELFVLRKFIPRKIKKNSFSIFSSVYCVRIGQSEIKLLDKICFVFFYDEMHGLTSNLLSKFDVYCWGCNLNPLIEFALLLTNLIVQCDSGGICRLNGNNEWEEVQIFKDNSNQWHSIDGKSHTNNKSKQKKNTQNTVWFGTENALNRAFKCFQRKTMNKSAEYCSPNREINVKKEAHKSKTKRIWIILLSKSEWVGMKDEKWKWPITVSPMILRTVLLQHNRLYNRFRWAINVVRCDFDRFVYRWMTPINLGANKMHWKSHQRFDYL